MNTSRKGRPRGNPIAIATVAAAILISFIGLSISVNPALTRYVEGPAFREALEKETARGLHFSDFHFAPIRRTGLLSAESAHAQAKNGRKALTSLNAENIRAHYDPLGVLLRRWTIEDLHVERGQIGIQIYEPQPEPKPSRPWFAIFLPDRVYLKHVWSDHVDITWPMRSESAGVFDTHLVITPHGREFEYDATAGSLREPPLPKMALTHTHLLITKTLFKLYALDATSGERGTIHAEGNAATRGDKNLHFNFHWNNLALTEWLPASWKEHCRGEAEGEMQWTGRDYKLASATMRGSLLVHDGRVSGLNLLDQIAAIAGRPDLRTLQLTECSTRFAWQKSDCELSGIALEERGKFRIGGQIRIKDDSLGGKIDLGLAPEYLAWLPHPEEVFTRESDGYRWTTIHLSGTPDKPQQDLSPRIMKALEGSPSALLGAALRGFGLWLRSPSGSGQR